MAYNIVKDLSQLDTLMTDIKLSQPKTNGAGGQTVYINRKNGSKVLIQTPMMPCPFGLSEWGEGMNKKYSIDGSFNGVDHNKDMENLLKFVENFDTYIKSIPTQDPSWFKSTKTAGVIDELFRPSTRKHPEGKYAPTMKFKLHEVQKEIATSFYDERSQKINKEELTKGSKLICIIEPASVWFVNKMFGISWKVHQVMVFAPANMSACLIDNGADSGGVSDSDLNELNDFMVEPDTNSTNVSYSPWNQATVNG
tara:strand:- start:4777 stop:5535 length:759 start_codon:yes stop_codon:yes gene_type:complete